MEAMTDLPHPFRRHFIFFNDILIYSKDKVSHMQHLQKVLDVFLASKFFTKLSKCVFWRTLVDYLGHMMLFLDFQTVVFGFPDFII